MQRETKACLRDLGFRIGELRARQGLTQEGAAEKIGMLTPNYARLEQGRANCTVDTLVRIAKMLDLPVYELFKKPTKRTATRGRPPKKT